jgi:membrane fusion protein, multidrug efflux system
MDPTNSEPPVEPVDSRDAAAPRRISRRATIIGSLIAIAVVAGIGWLAWNLTRFDTATVAEVGRAGGGARPGGSAGGAGTGGGGGGRAGGAGRGPATTVGVAIAEATDIPIVIDALGTVIPQATVRVRPQVSGVLQQVLYKEGQTVRKGDLLALIDPRQFEMALQQTSGQRMRDEAQLEAARVTLARFRTLLQQDSIARQEVDTQAALVKQLEASLVMSKANEGTARLNLAYTRVVAPVAGRVGLRVVDVGNVVNSGDANGVALITQMTPIDVEFAIPQDQVPFLQQNAGAFMEVKAFDRTRTTVLDTGVFASLDNQIDTQTGTVRAKARFNNARLTLFPSQFVNVQLNLRTVKDAVVVPVAALRHGSTGDYVFVLKDDRTVALRPVTRAQATVDKVQIASGLQVGERVITEGADRLRDGSRVVLPGDAPAAGGRRVEGGGRRRDAASAPAAPAAEGASAPGRPASPEAAAPAPVRRPAAAASTPENRTAVAATVPTEQQKQRFLDQVKDDPEALQRRKAFLEQIGRGDPAALERWQRILEQRGEGARAAVR